jgi:phospholipid/cholesterol/gamma-HCH transport system substrate-binding protein
LPEGAVVRGLDPPRLDMLLAESYELLHSTVAAVRDNRKEISETFDALRITLKGTGTFFSNNQDKLDRIVTNVETATVEGNDLIKGANEKFVKNPQVDRIIDNVDSVTAQANREAPQIIADTKATLANAKRASDAVGSEEQAAKLKKAVDGGVALVDKANATMNDAQYMTAQIRKGRGTVGALLMDEQLFDDLQEMVRDLKHNPWKFFWRE